MNVVFIVPTGIGAEIGGHSGDATPAAKMIASACDKLIVHPNVVNASDINEMTDNMLYVEGSFLDRFLEGEFGFQEVRSNKIRVAVNEPKPEIVNSLSAARVTLGANVDMMVLEKPIRMVATMDKGQASGEVYNHLEAVEQFKEHDDFDVLVVNTPIEADDEAILSYLRKVGGTNVWGGVEAHLSKLMSNALGKQVIHAPVENSKALKTFMEIVEPRKSAEMVSTCYLHCCLKGAHRAPRQSGEVTSLWNMNIDFLVTPANVFGRPHRACVAKKIPVIAVKENKTVLNDEMPDDFIVVENYLEAAGVISAKKAGVTLASVRRPFEGTKVALNQGGIDG